MIGMRERVLALGGTMTVASTSRAITVEALVPNRIRQLRATEPLSLLLATCSGSPCSALTERFGIITLPERGKHGRSLEGSTA